MWLNWSAHADTRQQVVAARRMSRAGGLQRYATGSARSVNGPEVAAILRP